MTCSEHERKLVRVYRVHLAIINDYTYVTGVATCERTRLHTFHNTLQDGRHEARINGTTNYGVDKYELAAPLKVDFLTTLDVHLELLTIELVCCRIWHTLSIWLNDEVNLTKLSGTTTLFLVTVVCTCHLGNGLTIRYLRFTELHLYLLVVLQTPLQCAQMELTLTMHNGLAQLLGLLNNPCRVFLTHL